MAILDFLPNDCSKHLTTLILQVDKTHQVIYFTDCSISVDVQKRVSSHPLNACRGVPVDTKLTTLTECHQTACGLILGGSSPFEVLGYGLNRYSAF
jgi:hypothetical protein